MPLTTTLLALALLGSTSAAGREREPAASALARGAAALDAGRPAAALELAERLLLGGLQGYDRREALALAEAAAAALNQTVKARFYRLARSAPETVPPAVIRDLAEERFLDFVANAELALARSPTGERDAIRLDLFDAFLALGRLSDALEIARNLPASLSGELLLELAREWLAAGQAAAAFDAAASAQPPEEGEEEDPGDERGFLAARASLIAAALLNLGEPEAAGQAAVEAAQLASTAEERDRAHRLLEQARRALDTGRADDCSLLQSLPELR